MVTAMFKKRVVPQSTAATPAPQPRRASGDGAVRDSGLTFRPCSHRGCSVATGMPCTYTDRAGQGCATAWCPDHRLTIEGRVFCRRHGGTMSALPVGAARGAPLPSVDTRAPSLVSWVAREIDDDVRQLLLAASGGADGARLVVDPVFLSSSAIGSRGWERSWRLIAGDGSVVRVAIAVHESADDEVVVSVGGAVVGRFVPPWIADRHPGDVAGGAADADSRERFNGRLIAMIGGAINRLANDHHNRVDRSS